MSLSDLTRKNPPSPNSTLFPVGGMGSRPGSSAGPLEVPTPTSSSRHKITFCRDVHDFELKVGHGFEEPFVDLAMAVAAPDAVRKQRPVQHDLRCELLPNASRSWVL